MKKPDILSFRVSNYHKALFEYIADCYGVNNPALFRAMLLFFAEHAPDRSEVINCGLDEAEDKSLEEQYESFYSLRPTKRGK